MPDDPIIPGQGELEDIDAPAGEPAPARDAIPGEEPREPVETGDYPPAPEGADVIGDRESAPRDEDEGGSA